MTTLTIMRQLPREVDPLVYKMSHEDPGNISYAEVGGLAEQIRELREVSYPLKATIFLKLYDNIIITNAYNVKGPECKVHKSLHYPKCKILFLKAYFNHLNFRW